jgi:tetratricopeptide (TPR) repeat protein
MNKSILCLILPLVLGASWIIFATSGRKMDAITHQIQLAEDKGDPEDVVPKLRDVLQGMEGERTFQGILLTFLNTGVIGVFFVIYVLPFFAQRVSHSIFDSAEVLEKDFMRDARSLVAQGEYQRAIESFKECARAEPLNRLPWMEIGKIQEVYLADPAAAIETLQHALDQQEWPMEDACYFLFRLADLYYGAKGDRAAAVAIMNQVIEQFPETRHSGNAHHKLHVWSRGELSESPAVEAASEPVTDEAAKLVAEEAEFSERLRQKAADKPDAVDLS